MPRLTSALVLAAALAGAVPASAAITTFANYSGVGGANIYWQRSGTHYAPGASPATTAASAAAARASAGGRFFTIATPTAATPGAVAAIFTFLNPELYGLGPLDAAYRLDATATPGSVALAAGGFDYQPIVSGTFSFTYTGLADLTIGGTTHHTGANLLSASFTGGTIAGQGGATSGVASASTTVAGETIAYSSDFIDFSRTRDQDLAISLTSISRALSFTDNEALHSFAATSTGSFSTDPLPRLVGDLPEPANWALMVVGFGLVGVGRRRTPAAA